ncbi:fructose-specific PTS transporter subunit EIIC [Mycoplasmoides pneumoniae]|uniref:PTS system protein n=2 Tax=Mycoplasmoides pneumoniae TaxID=2104 RepID=A0AAV5N7I4_MYCPM|nr:fructose-specific PTS transporter subunit EIIC [Mycoplasmoides pneumoniae]ALA30925.1 fructose permease IIC protein [Mycoplasmoides pneumoniae 19294]ALA31361.1 fructose permease IIC protein [Mycoplasmoides pneumoniae 39443]ALA35593.1 fructose permease IIC protein [Mycoplasmoides pneumoniae FH]ALA36299.1 fructose permease IIC protein [Mycoplasmoides pneumoniae M1139]ALA37012.1 fructose permease IIC protein [Mycoplasmoides pneumoniae]
MFKPLLSAELFFNWTAKDFKDKTSFLKQACRVLQAKNCIKEEQIALTALKEREAQITTGIMSKLALPHMQSATVLKPFVAVFKVNNVDWQSLDNQPVKLIFLIGVPKDQGNLHLEFISQFSKLMLQDEFANKVPNIRSFNGLINLIDSFQQTAVASQPVVNEAAAQTEEPKDTNTQYDFVAVTACPTGIAHTFMAKEALEKFARDHNLKVKVETQGTDGIQNQLTESDLNNTKGIILACDRLIDLTRFYGHANVVEVSTTKAIKTPQTVYDQVVKKEGKLLGNKSSDSASQTELKETTEQLSFKDFHKRIYRAILSGVSYMLPFVVFGGILIAIAFLIDINNAGNAGKQFGSKDPIANWFKTLGGLSFGLIVPILSAYIAFALVGRQGLLPGFIVGLISAGKFLLNIDIVTGKIDWATESKVSSGFFGAIFGGLLAAVLIIVQQRYIYRKLPQALQGIKNILFIPLLGTLVTAALFWVINIPLIYLNYGLSKFLQIMDKPYLAPLLGLVIGLMMCFDLGGPVNKAAYVFGVVSLESQNSGTVAMASAILSGMVPPLGIAIAATIRKQCFDKEELPAAYACYVMGLSFISEGAIPFVAKRPKIMLAANLIGGAVCGVLTGAFALTIRAPHGGVFVFALLKTNLEGIAGNTLQIGAGVGLALLALIVSSFISAGIIIGHNLLVVRKKTKQLVNTNA